ncbi:Fe(2+) transporter permease subunit FeoB [Pseudomonas schmalbachii]|uniref:Ferrous iron transport protein B n=1 Tax=Pseudomonas schmalbachii TaxID=2816993 RepID=A0ABS3TJS1_9PSED|nr:Fe(2+) transporter permease subunit FeoB [Pseudomonas schmalbachii]MBO3273912.1 Fe(2+) transporter permease subunit FeoB [Pseudomonas schmalbachii]
MSEHRSIALVGNPNCGKTTVFNALTGSRQRVGNWPGVTVERKSGEYRFEGERYEVVDLPGTYSLDVVDQEVSLDEKIARDYVHANEADLIVNIVDASNLERNLYLTLQLAEMQVPLLVVLNMIDVAEEKAMRVDADKLAERLGCPVVPVVASEGSGIDELKAVVRDTLRQARRPGAAVTYDSGLEQAIEQLLPQLTAAVGGTAPRWLAVRLLEGDDLARAAAGPQAVQEAAQLAQELGDDIDIMVADARYGLANSITRDALTMLGRTSRDLTDRIDRVVLNRALGIPIFFAMMYLMFMFTINIGSSFIDFFDQLGALLFVDGLGQLLGAIGTPDWLVALLTQGIGAGVQTVATFIPVIGFLFLFLSFLEDSGYMARAAFVMDRFMRWVGLPGKSFVPMIVGFGCTVPAIMATRTLEHRRDRLLTIAMAPFMSCGARLPVYVLFAAAFFPEHGQNIVFGLYIIGIGAAVLTGLLLKHSLLEGEATPFIMELPPYHIPTIKGVLLHTWSRLKGFVVKAGRIIVPTVLVLNMLNSTGTDGSFASVPPDHSVLAEVGRGIAPAFSPMGVTADNWPAAVGIITGILAKEAVVGTLNTTYGALAGQAEEAEEGPFDLWGGIADAFATIPANLAEAFGRWTDPLGLEADLSDQATVAAAHDVSSSIFGAMVTRFVSTSAAFAYLLFVLLYSPCTAAMAAVYQEAGTRWMLFVVAWTTGLAYGVAVLFYQLANWAAHPLGSLAWCAGVLIAFAAAFMSMRIAGRSEPRVAVSLPVPRS